MLYRCHWRITGDVRCEIPYSMQYKLWSYATFLKLLTSQPWRGQHPALTLKSSQVSIIRGVHYLLHLLLQGIFNWKEKGRGGNESGIFHSFCSSLNTHSLFNLFSPQHHEQGITSTVRCGWMCLCLRSQSLRGVTEVLESASALGRAGKDGEREGGRAKHAGRLFTDSCRLVGDPVRVS